MQRTASRIGFDRRALRWDDGSSNQHFARVYAVAGAIRHAEVEAARAARSCLLARRKLVAAASVAVEAGRMDLASLDPQFAALVVRQQRRVARRAAKGLPEPDLAEDERFAESRRFAHAMVRQRLKAGFVGGHALVGRRWRGEVVEQGLRSDDSLNVRIFVQRISKKPRGGMTKGFLEIGDAKLLTLDEPYVEFNKRFWSMFRIDIDRNFASWGDLHRQLSALGLPALPHLVVADVDPTTGAVVRPHLLYHLPWQSAVWNDPEDPRCRVAPRRLFQAVHRGLVNALRQLGADPGCLANPHHGKSATSPYWHVVDDWETEVYPSLSDWAAARDAQGARLLNLNVTVEGMVRDAATTLHDDPDTSPEAKAASNRLFSDLCRVAWKTVSHWRKADDVRYANGVADRSRLAEDLKDVLLHRGRQMFDGEKRIDRVADVVSSFVATVWNPARADSGRSIARGRDSHMADLGEDTRTRQSRSARVTSEARSKARREDVLEALREADSRGESTTCKAIASRLGIDPRTVAKHRRAVMVDDVKDKTSFVRDRVDDGEAEVLDISGLDVLVPVSASQRECFLSIHRIVVGAEGAALAQVELASDVDSERLPGSRSVDIDPPDPPWHPPTPAPSQYSDSTSQGSPAPHGARATALLPRSVYWDGRPMLPRLRRPISPLGSRIWCSSLTPPSSSSNATSSAGAGERTTKHCAKPLRWSVVDPESPDWS